MARMAKEERLSLEEDAPVIFPEDWPYMKRQPDNQDLIEIEAELAADAANDDERVRQSIELHEKLEAIANAFIRLSERHGKPVRTYLRAVRLKIDLALHDALAELIASKLKKNCGASSHRSTRSPSSSDSHPAVPTPA